MLDTFLNAVSARLYSKCPIYILRVQSNPALRFYRLKEIYGIMAESGKKYILYPVFGFKVFSFKVSLFLLLKFVMACLKTLPETSE